MHKLVHPLNQRDEVALNEGSASAGPGLPSPEEAEAKAMPSDDGYDGLGLEENQNLLPAWPEAQQTNPKQSVGGTEFGFARLPSELDELMPERQIFKHKPGMGLEAGEQGAKERQDHIKHGEANFDRPY